MKIKFILSSIIISSLSLASCNLEPDKDNNYQTLNYSVCNLVIPSDGASFATMGLYSLIYYTTEGTVAVQTSNLSLGYGESSFTTSAMPYKVQAYTQGGNSYFEVSKFSGGITNDTGFSVNQLSGYTSTIVNTLVTGDPAISDYPTLFYPALVMQYNINQNYTVKTFMRDEIFSGVTTIRTESSGQSFSNEEVRYRVFFKDDMKTADVIFYSAKFAENMPVTITFRLKGLNVVYNKTGYAVQIPAGEKVVPDLFEGGAFTPYPSYTFSSFILSTTSEDLSKASINYTVESTRDKYYGMFAGEYVSSGPETNN